MQYFYGFGLNIENALEIVMVLPLLSELKLYLGDKFSNDDVIRFVAELKQMETLTIGYKSMIYVQNWEANGT